MPKHEKNSPKAISNRIKSKGLQKLRWFCQMCRKQCRDQNGFKCHLTSESHQRQLLLFAENKSAFLSEYSGQFEKSFMDILRLNFGGKRVKANDVYVDYIKDKSHVHMNSTHWHTLTGFVLYLARSGKCKIDQNEKGWFIQYIDKEEEMRKEKIVQKVKHDKDDEEKILDFVEKQAQRAKDALPEGEIINTPTEMIKDNDKKIEFYFSKPKKPRESELLSLAASSSNKNSAAIFSNDLKSIKGEIGHWNNTENSANKRCKKSALDEIRESEERKKEQKNRKDHWLHADIVVKVVTNKLGSYYCQKKGVVTTLVDDYTANVRILDDKGDVLKLDQVHLETVIPAIGKPILIVNGAYRGSKAILETLDEKNYCVSAKIDKGPDKGRKIDRLQYEDVCKLAI